MKTYMIMAVAAIVSLLFVAAAHAYECRTHTIMTPDGRLVTCTVCCDGLGNCNQTCF